MLEKSFIIAGAGWAGSTIASVMAEKSPDSIVGFVDDRTHLKSIVVANGNGGIPVSVLGHSGDLVEVVKRHGAQAVVIAVTHNREDHLLSQIVKCHESGIPVYEMPDLYARLTHKIPLQHVKQHWILPHLRAPKHDLYTFFNDLVNYLFSIFGFVFVFAPLFPFVALAIKADSPGPVLFRQKRVGRRGKVFTLLKFRTMFENAALSGSKWTSKNDPRITRIGAWLRKFRLDELPQLVNILSGEMALIGPRPEAVELVEMFRKEIPFYEQRYLVSPGITGWAQVNYENTCSVEGALEKLQYDLYWIKNRSLWLNIKIIFKSIKVMLTGFGAV